MNPTTGIVATAVVVTIGRWAEGKQLDAKVMVGAAFAGIILTFTSDVNEKLAGQFTLLILVAALLRYGTGIAKKTGLAK